MQPLLSVFTKRAVFTERTASSNVATSVAVSSLTSATATADLNDFRSTGRNTILEVLETQGNCNKDFLSGTFKKIGHRAAAGMRYRCHAIPVPTSGSERFVATRARMAANRRTLDA